MANNRRTPSPLSFLLRPDDSYAFPDPRLTPRNNLRSRVESDITLEDTLIEALSPRRTDGFYASTPGHVEEPYLGHPPSREFLSPRTSRGFRSGSPFQRTPRSAPARIPFRMRMQEAGFIPQRFSSADIIPPFEEPLTFSSPSDNNNPSASNNDNTDNMENQPHPNIQANINSNQGRTSPQLPRGIILGTGGPRRNVGADPPIPYAHLQSQIRGRNVGVDPPIPYLIQGQFRGRGRQFSFRGQGTPPQAARSRGNRGRIPSNPGAPRIVVTAPGAPAIHQDPHHPVFPPHEKIEVKIAEWEEFHEHPGFKLTFSFRRDIGMRHPGADCGCQVGGAHYCCGECRMINTILIPEEREEFRDILLDFEFSDSPSICAVQTLFVLVHNLPLALHVLSVGMRRLAQTAAVLTIFFEDIQAVHRFVSHVVHAVVAYSSHEDFVTSKLRRVGIDQTVNDELRGVMRKKGEKVLLRGYTQGGVGHGLVKIEGFEMQNDWQLAVWVGNGEKGVLVGAKCTSRQVGLVF